jgi:cellulase/cellobiase CelA1/aryl-phospho-beta-D-glucosidase BglC (GH1 family)/chitodextrinase
MPRIPALLHAFFRFIVSVLFLVSMVPTRAVAQHVPNPFAGAAQYVNPDYAKEVDTLVAQTADPNLAAQMKTVGTYPTAVWLDNIAAIAGNSVGGGRLGLAEHLDAALAQQQSGSPIVVTLVIYDLPGRDCAALASNGELSIAANPPAQPLSGVDTYRTKYIDAITSVLSNPKYAGIRVVAVIEPDSLPNLVTNLNLPACAAANSSGAYVQSIQYAITQLHQFPNVYQYLDIGHSAWLGWPSNFGPAVTLFTNVVKATPAGLNTVDGFISNTANYTPTKEPFMSANQTVGGQQLISANFYQFDPYIDEAGYDAALYQAFVNAGWPSTIGFLVDTSRNGWGGANRPAGPSSSADVNTFVNATRIDKRNHRGQWCNQSGAGLGVPPLAAPPGFFPQLQAFVWIKPPGESDGSYLTNLTPHADPNCDPAHANALAGNTLTGSLPNSPIAGAFFPAEFTMLVQNAFPAIPASTNADFSVSANGTSLMQSGTGSTTVTVLPVNNFTGTVDLSATGLPSGVTAAFAPASVTGAAVSTLTFTATAAAIVGTANITITGTSGGLTHQTTISLTVIGKPEFSISVAPAAITLAPGTNPTATITITPLFGFTGTVSLSASGLPAGAQANFSPSSVNGSGTIIVNFNAQNNTPAGTFNVSLTGTSGALVHSTPLAVTVPGGATPDFSLSATPAMLSIAQGSNGTSTIGVMPMNGFNSAASLSATGLPAGVTASFSGTTLTLSASATATAGPATATVTGTGGGLTRTVPIALTITATGGGGTPATGYWHTQGNQILDANDQPVRIAGVNWYGFETTDQIVHGLWAKDYHDVLNAIKNNGYNTVRIPFSNQMVESGTVPTNLSFNGAAGAINTDLRGLTSLQILDKIIDAAGALGLRVILDNHRSEAGNSAEASGLWFTSAYPESAWINDWVTLTQRYAGNPTVVGMDLRNEPHNANSGGACWGCGTANDWSLAAERAGNAVLAVNPSLLIFVEGNDCFNGDCTWWGGNLEGVQNFPVTLNVPNRLVYSAHDYGPNLFVQNWFNGNTTYATLVAVWQKFWGYVSVNQIAPVWVGEFGTTNNTADIQNNAAGSQGQWFQSLVTYLHDNPALSWTYWALNGEDSYALLDANYDATPASALKQQMLASIQFPFAGGGAPDTQAPSVPTGLTVTGTSQTTVGLSWNASTDNVGVTGYDVLTGSTVVGSTTTTSFTVTGLTAGTTYSFAVRAKDAAGNLSAASAAVSVATVSAPGGDTTPPSAPTGLTVAGKTSLAVSLTWTASTDNVGVTGYDVLNGASVAGTTASTAFTVTGLSPNTTYTFAVRARDAVGNVSAASVPVTVTTNAAADTQPPSTPTGLVVTGTTTATVGLSWSGSTDNVGVAGYDVLSGATVVGSTSATSFTVTGLSSGTTYSFAVRAKDSAGNMSAASAPVSATTMSAGTGSGATSLKVQYRTHDTESPDNQIYALYQIVNTGNTPVPMSALTMRYWYTKDGAQLNTFECDYALVGCANVTGKFVTMTTPVTNADSYVEIGFTAGAGTLAAGQSSGEVQTRYHRSDWTNFQQSNDYSLDPTQNFVYKDWPKVTLYLNGVLVWGVEPTGTAAPSGGGDTQPPSTPTGLAASNVASTSVVLTWNASTDNVGTTGYDVLSGATAIGSTASLSFTVTGLNRSTTYSFTVRAKDAAGNVSAASAPVSVTTAAAGGGTPVAGLKIQYRTHDTESPDNQIYALYQIVNAGTTPVPMSALTLRYWYTKDGAQLNTFECDYALVGCANVTGKFVTLPAPVPNADSYVEIGFTAAAGTLAAGQSSGEIQTRYHRSDWTNFLQSNDYSLDPTQNFVYEDWQKVTLYLNGVLVWGVEPK